MVFKKTKNVPMSKLLEVKKAEYITVQLIPTKSNKNNATSSIATLINSMYVKVNKLITIENKKLIIKNTLKASYYIHITKKDVGFYFIIPKVHFIKFKSKFTEVWKNIEIREVDSIPIDPNECTKYQLRYSMNHTLSLRVDKRNNE